MRLLNKIRSKRPPPRALGAIRYRIAESPFFRRRRRRAKGLGGSLPLVPVERYQRPHRHVHGANVGCRADAYVAAGGFLALSSDEDVALAGALAGRRTVRTGAIPVLTSARRVARLHGGFADYLIKLA